MSWASRVVLGVFVALFVGLLFVSSGKSRVGDWTIANRSSSGDGLGMTDLGGGADGGDGGC